MQLPVVPEQHDADRVRVEVEGDAEDLAGKGQQFLEADTGQTGDRGDAGGDGRDGADLVWGQLRCECLCRLTDGAEGLV